MYTSGSGDLDAAVEAKALGVDACTANPDRFSELLLGDVRGVVG